MPRITPSMASTSETRALNRGLRAARAGVAADDPDAAADAILAALHEAMPAPPARRRPLVLSGCIRSGKTLLAQRLARDMSCPFLPGDRLRYLYRRLAQEPQRNRLRWRLLRRLLRTAPGGLIVEGADLAHRNQAPYGGTGGVTLRLLRHLRRAGLAEVAVVGNADTCVADKRRAIEAWRATGECWTTRPAVAGHYADPAAIEALARSTIRRSRVLRKQAAAAGIPYLEIRPEAFEADIAAHTATLRAWLEPE